MLNELHYLLKIMLKKMRLYYSVQLVSIYFVKTVPGVIALFSITKYFVIVYILVNFRNYCKDIAEL